MLGLILFFQILIIFFMILCFIVLKQQHKDININTSTTRHYISSIIKQYSNKNNDDNDEIYVLVKFPESQKYMSFKQCHACFYIDGAYFVPKCIYDKEK